MSTATSSLSVKRPSLSAAGRSRTSDAGIPSPEKSGGANSPADADDIPSLVRSAYDSPSMSAALRAQGSTDGSEMEALAASTAAIRMTHGLSDQGGTSSVGERVMGLANDAAGSDSLFRRNSNNARYSGAAVGSSQLAPAASFSPTQRSSSVQRVVSRSPALHSGRADGSEVGGARKSDDAKGSHQMRSISHSRASESSLAASGMPAGIGSSVAATQNRASPAWTTVGLAPGGTASPSKSPVAFPPHVLEHRHPTATERGSPSLHPLNIPPPASRATPIPARDATRTPVREQHRMQQQGQASTYKTQVEDPLSRGTLFYPGPIFDVPMGGSSAGGGEASTLPSPPVLSQASSSNQSSMLGSVPQSPHFPPHLHAHAHHYSQYPFTAGSPHHQVGPHGYMDPLAYSAAATMDPAQAAIYAASPATPQGQFFPGTVSSPQQQQHMQFYPGVAVPAAQGQVYGTDGDHRDGLLSPYASSTHDFYGSPLDGSPNSEHANVDPAATGGGSDFAGRRRSGDENAANNQQAYQQGFVYNPRYPQHLPTSPLLPHGAPYVYPAGTGPSVYHGQRQRGPPGEYGHGRYSGALGPSANILPPAPMVPGMPTMSPPLTPLASYHTIMPAGSSMLPSGRNTMCNGKNPSKQGASFRGGAVGRGMGPAARGKRGSERGRGGPASGHLRSLSAASYNGYEGYNGLHQMHYHPQGSHQQQPLSFVQTVSYRDGATAILSTSALTPGYAYVPPASVLAQQGRRGNQRHQPHLRSDAAAAPSAYGPSGGITIPSGVTLAASSSPNWSPLLEEFRSRTRSDWTVAELHGHIREFSTDQHGSRFIQERLSAKGEEADEERELVFDELEGDSVELMKDAFGNYVVQKLIEHGTAAQREVLIEAFTGNMLDLSRHTYGCRVVQKGMDYLSEDQLVALAHELKDEVHSCVQDQNANHVLQKMLESCEDPTRLQFIPDAFEGKVSILAKHCYSCRVLQRVFENCNSEQTAQLLQEVHDETKELMQDQYGNYVIQWLLQRKSNDSLEVIKKTKGSFVSLSKHKFASNVLEIVVSTSKEMTPTDGREQGAYFADIIEEILAETADESDTSAATASSSKDPSLIGAIQMMNHSYANYVLQQILHHAEEADKRRIADTIRPELVRLRSQPTTGNAKHLLAIEKLVEGDGL